MMTAHRDDLIVQRVLARIGRKIRQLPDEAFRLEVALHFDQWLDVMGQKEEEGTGDTPPQNPGRLIRLSEYERQDGGTRLGGRFAPPIQDAIPDSCEER